MAHEAIQENTLNHEGIPVPPRRPYGPMELHHSQEASVLSEKRHLMGVLATDLMISVGVTSDPDLKVQVVENFLGNVERTFPDFTEMDRREFVMHLIETAGDRVKTETAAAFKAQNELLLENQEKIKDILVHYSVDILKEAAPYLKKPVAIEIDMSEFTGELSIPTTNELEASLNNVTDETVSPPRGIALQYAQKTGHTVLTALHLLNPMRILK